MILCQMLLKKKIILNKMKLNKIVSTLAAIATVAMFASCGSSEAPAASEAAAAPAASAASDGKNVTVDATFKA